MDNDTARLNHAPDLSSRSRGWGGVVADLHWWRGPGEAMSLAPDHDVVAMRMAGATPLTQRRDGKVDERIVRYGNVTIHPHGMDSHWSWTHSGAILLMRLPPAIVAEVHRHGAGPTDLPNCFGAQDPVIESYMRLVEHELHAPEDATKALRWQSLSLAIASHLVEQYADRALDVAPKAGLSDEALERVFELVGDRWRESPSLQDLADAAGVSRYHFSRRFKASTGMTPMAYVDQARLNRAKALIVDARHSMAEVALMTGFVDQSHFVRRFRRAFGLTPGVFAKNYPRRGR